MRHIDFSKAFDKVPDQRLLLTLQHYGVSGNLQKVVEDRVTQGTVLGPLLFLAYVNDMSEGIRSTVKLSADNSLLYRKIYN